MVVVPEEMEKDKEEEEAGPSISPRRSSIVSAHTRIPSRIMLWLSEFHPHLLNFLVGFSFGGFFFGIWFSTRKSSHFYLGLLGWLRLGRTCLEEVHAEGGEDGRGEPGSMVVQRWCGANFDLLHKWQVGR